MSTIIKRIRNWLAGMQDSTELRRLDTVELERIADDVGLSPAELVTVVSRGPDAAALLPRRMEALHLDPNRVAARDLAVFRDMQRLCTLCTVKGRCERDLAEKPFDPSWEQYCPNAFTLRDLNETVRRDAAYFRGIPRADLHS